MITILISKAIRAMAVYIFGASGNTLIEKSGHLNMGVPGIMFFGALGGVIGEICYANSVPIGTNLNIFLVIFMPILFAILFGGIGGLLFCFLTVTLKCNQNVVGLALTTLFVGISKFFLSALSTIDGSRVGEAGSMIQHLFPDYAKAGVFGEMFLSGSFFTYFSIIVAIAITLILNRTRIGLNLRACGENPSSADAAGINVIKYRYLGTIIGCAIVGLGGATYSIDYTIGNYSATNPIDSYGWLCLSIVILSAWRSWISIFVSFAIGFLTILPVPLNLENSISQLLNAIPYVATIIVLIITSAISSKKMQPPGALGQTYFREDR